MLALDSAVWGRLTHAYGAADDIPRLLEQLACDPRRREKYTDEPWFTLWSSLCHQGDAYDASFAAVPRIVAIAAATTGPIDFSFFSLPAAIEVARMTGRAPPLPRDLAPPYLAALRDIHRAAFLHAGDAWDRPMALSIIAALVAAKGDTKLAEALNNLDDEIIVRIVDLDL